MKYDDIRAKTSGRVNEIELSGSLKSGGETAMLRGAFEQNFPNKVLVAMEINDVYPSGWDDSLRKSIGEESLRNQAEWAFQCAEKFDADLIFLDMTGTHQDRENISPDRSAEIMNGVLRAVSIPVIIRPEGNNDKRNSVISICSQTAERPVILGSALQENYKTITACAMAGGHLLIAESPIDVNIAKQLNILITQMNYPVERIIMDPLTGGLGYGLEYTYSVMERIRLQTFNDDKMMSPPMICIIGPESWKVKEIRTSDGRLGDTGARGVHWETAAALSLILSGADIVSVRHPESVKRIKEFVDKL